MNKRYSLIGRLGFLSIFAMLGACGADDESTSDVGQAWSCDAKDSTLVCTTATSSTTTKPTEKPFYACNPGDKRAACPSPASVAGAGDLAKFLDKNRIASDEFDKMPWGCILTGSHQRQCVRDIEAARRCGDDGKGGSPGAGGSSPPGSPTVPPGGDNSGGGSGNGGGGNSGNGGNAGNGGPPSGGGTSGMPVPPTSCNPGAWEPYFAILASSEYTAHGVHITFPRDIFDVSANFNRLSIESASVKVTPGAPSCGSGEWAMRQQAWLDAVTRGCTGLDDAILVLCQEAANYAPNAGACNATGTW